ncbi:MAG: spore coat U domain-containing protein [Pseudomonadota bacterium]
MKAIRALPLIALLPLSAFAGTASDNFQVTLTITGACSLVANDLDFGTNNGAIIANIDATSTLVPNCTNGTVYSIGLNNGVGSGATASVRKMTNSADSSTVNYSLYTSAARSTVWDNNCTALPAGSTCVGGTGSGANQTLTVYGRVPGGQSNVTVGSYVDTVVATLTF